MFRHANRRSLITWLATLCALVAGCASQVDKGAPGFDPVLPGKADVVSDVAMQGNLGTESVVRGSFAEEGEFHGYTVNVLEDSKLIVRIAHSITSEELDTVLYVYGADGGVSYRDAPYPVRLAFDDDGGQGLFSRIRNLELTAGEYLVVLGTYDGTGVGDYGLQLKCSEGAACSVASAVDPNDPVVSPVALTRWRSNPPHARGIRRNTWDDATAVVRAYAVDFTTTGGAQDVHLAAAAMAANAEILEPRGAISERRFTRLLKRYAVADLQDDYSLTYHYDYDAVLADWARELGSAHPTWTLHLHTGVTNEGVGVHFLSVYGANASLVYTVELSRPR